MNAHGSNPAPRGGAVPQRLGNFELLGCITQDPAGAVHRARSLETGATVILRALDPLLSDEAAFRDRFYPLIKLVSALRHPNLATVLGGGESDQHFFIVSENHEGEPLAHWIEREGALPQKTAVGAALCVANALAHVWETAQLFHGNLAPQQIFVDDNGDVKLFDLALPERAETRCRFAAPEILDADPDADFRADIFSLGLILYYAVTAQIPFSSPTLKTRADILKSEQLPDPRQFAPETSNALCRVLQKMLARRPADRFGDWHQVQSALADLLEDTTPAITPVAPHLSVLRIEEPAMPQQPEVQAPSAAMHTAVVHLSLAAVPAAGAKPFSPSRIPVIAAAAEEISESPPKKSTLLPTLSIIAAAAVIVLVAVWAINTYRFQQITQPQSPIAQATPPQAAEPAELAPPDAANPQPPPLPQPPQENHAGRPRRGWPLGKDNENHRAPHQAPPQRQAGNAPLEPLLPLLGGLVEQPQKRNEAIAQALNPAPRPDPDAPKPPAPSAEDAKRTEAAQLAAERDAHQQQERARLAAAFNQFAESYLQTLSRRDYKHAQELARAASADPALQPRRATLEQCIEAAARLQEFYDSLGARLARAKGRLVSWGGVTGVVSEVADQEVVLEKNSGAVGVAINAATAEEILALTTPLPTSTTAEAWLNAAWFSFAEGKIPLARIHLANALKNGVATDGIALTMAMLSAQFAELEAEQILVQLRESVRLSKFDAARAAIDKLKEFFSHTRSFRASDEFLRSVESAISFHESFAASPANNVFRTLHTPQPVTALAFSADGRHVVAASDNTLRIWELASGQIVRELSSSEVKMPNITFVALSPNNRFALAAFQGQLLALWDVGASKPLGVFPSQPPAAVFTPDGKYLAYCSNTSPAEIRLMPLSAPDNERTIQLEPPARPIQHLAVSPDSKFIAAWSSDRSLQIFNLATGKSHRNHAAPAGPIANSIALTADAKLIVISCQDGALRVFDAETGKEIRVFTRRTTPAVRTAYSPDGRFALGVHDNHKMTLMDSVSGDEWHTVEANQNAIKAVALSPDRRIAVTASEKTISVWKLWDTEIAPAPK